MRLALLIILTALLAAGQPDLSLGQVQLNPAQRSLIIPAVVNQQEGIVEFLLVHQSGKVHEAVFSTAVPAVELAASLALLGLQADPTDHQHPQDLLADLHDHPAVHLHYSLDAGRSWLPASQLVSYTGAGAPLPTQPWRFTGSYFYRGTYMAQVEGDLVAIHTRAHALLNLAHADRDDDTRWHAQGSATKGDQALLRFTAP